MRRPLFMVCLCFVAAAALWLLCNSPGKTALQDEMSLPADGEKIIITGRVYEKGSGTFDSRIFKIESVKQSQMSSAAASQQRIPNGENLICETKDSASLCIGSTVLLKGTFWRFSEATNPGEFDTAQYYAGQGICGKIKDAEILEVGEAYSVVKEALYRVRCYFRERLYRVFPSKEASVLTAMLLGDKADLNWEIKKLYQDNGIIHILSISGLHITMIGMFIYKQMRRMGVPIWAAAVLGGIVLILYGYMTGMSVSACRAIGMYMLRMLAQVVGRTYDMPTALGVMAVLLVGQKPENVTSAGFLLSFGSIMGIGLLYPALIGEREDAVPKPIQALLTSSSITLFTLPIQLWFYYEVPVYSVILNVLVLPFMSVVMCTGLLAMLVPGLGVVGTVTCLILQGYEWMCELFFRLPWHRWNPGKPQAWQVVIYYLILSAVIRIGCMKAKDLQKNSRRCLWKIMLLAVAVIVFAIPARCKSTVTFLDVGQGDGIVLETASGEVYLFDCGSSSRKQVGEYVLLPFLKYRGIGQIDAVFVSHGDTDHYSGIIELLESGGKEGITVGQLVLPAIVGKEREEEFGELLQAVREAEQKKSITVSYMKAGDCFETKGASFLCLHPPGGYETEDGNAYSQCVYVELEGVKQREVSFLFTGDVEGEGEELLLQELKHYGIETATVLKVAHHGSRNATSQAFLKELNPQLAVISCGKGNSYGHPHIETLERLKSMGCRIVTTPTYGAITIEIGEGAGVYGFIR